MESRPASWTSRTNETCQRDDRLAVASSCAYAKAAVENPAFQLLPVSIACLLGLWKRSLVTRFPKTSAAVPGGRGESSRTSRLNRSVRSIQSDESITAASDDPLLRELEQRDFTIQAIQRNLENVVAMHEVYARRVLDRRMVSILRSGVEFLHGHGWGGGVLTGGTILEGSFS